MFAILDFSDQPVDNFCPISVFLVSKAQDRGAPRLVWNFLLL